jgi:hypothetical protein
MPVLESIIEDYQVKLMNAFDQGSDPNDPPVFNSNIYLRKLQLHLPGLIPDIGYARFQGRQDKMPGFSPITSAQDGNFKIMPEQSNQVFNMGCFSGSAGRDVPNGDYRQFKPG